MPITDPRNCALRAPNPRLGGGSRRHGMHATAWLHARYHSKTFFAPVALARARGSSCFTGVVLCTERRILLEIQQAYTIIRANQHVPLAASHWLATFQEKQLPKTPALSIPACLRWVQLLSVGASHSSQRDWLGDRMLRDCTGHTAYSCCGLQLSDCTRTQLQFDTKSDTEFKLSVGSCIENMVPSPVRPIRTLHFVYRLADCPTGSRSLSK
jgi:hypothetical protein